MSKTRTMRSGTLRVLINRTVEGDDFSWSTPLSWDGPPPDASWDDRFVDLDLGDYDCAPIPHAPPDGRGLWLLTWDWREVRHPEADDLGSDLTTAKYAPTCEWRRPTMDDLIALGVLPAPRAATTEGGTTSDHA